MIFKNRYPLYFKTFPECLVMDVCGVLHEVKVKVKVIPQQTDVFQGVSGRLRSRIFVTIGTIRVVGRQP